MIQARAGFLLKVADRIDARLDELAIAESRDQVFLLWSCFFFLFLFLSSFALFFYELMLTRDKMCNCPWFVFCVFVLCLDYLQARNKAETRFVCSCTCLFHVMLIWWKLTAWGLLAHSFSKFRNKVVVYAQWSDCLMLVVVKFSKTLNSRCVCWTFGHVFHLPGTPMNEIFRESQWTLPRRWTSPGPQ